MEFWMWFWTVFDFYLVFQLVEKAPLFALFPVLRLFDLLYIMVFVFLFNRPPKPPERALILLLVHYLEVIIAFASMYLVVQSIAGRCVFESNFVPKHLSGPEAIYFSFVTGSTIGFGDITIKLYPLSTDLSIWTLTAMTMVALELLSLLAITLLEIPRVLSHTMSTRAAAPK